MTRAVYPIVPLREVTSLITKGTTPTTLGHAFTDTGINFIKAEAVTLDGRIDESVFVHIDEHTHEKLKRSQIKEGDILFSIAGMKLGKSAVVKPRHLPANTNQALAIIRADRSRALPQYLHYYFLNPDHYRYVNALTAQAAQPNINLTQIGELQISLPALPIQRRIAGILSAYDDLIENNQRRIEIFEKMARAVYREWFVDFRFPGHEKVKLVDSPLGKIPQGWEVKKFRDVVNYNRRATKPGAHLAERRYVPIDCLPLKSLALLDAKPIEEAQSSLQLFEKGDVIFGAMRPYFHKVVIAPFAGVTRTTCFVLQPLRSEWRAFATLKAFDDETVAYANAHSQGATIPYAVWDGSLAEMPVVLPNDELLRTFERLVGPVLERISQTYSTLTNLRRTRDLLLPRLLSGQIDLSEVSKQEPLAA